MATIAATSSTDQKSVRRIPDLRYEHLFFTSMSVLMLLTVFFGFARTYYLAGIFHAPLPSLIIHIHGAAFTSWILLFVTQTSLVAADRTDIHRKLGIAGFLLACAMVILGVMAATDNLLRAHDVAGRDPKMFYIVPLTDMLLFGTFIYFAFRNRMKPAAHKRYIFLATTALLVAAIARLPFAFSQRKNPVDGALSDIFLLALVAYDLWSTRKIHRATLWSGFFLIFIQQVRIPIGKTAAWHAFATWVQTHVR
ncbi:MAG: hypothetical protein JSS69_09035 [Acidobacteria bacterium]|nr:hypothetical protein [Acidobacteriota bacterium]MBS1866049.1 hypothetical protein [Acidobacteriota bacterium]